jgi:hypothetical protein
MKEIKAVHTLRPSKDFKKLEFYQVEALLALLDEVVEENPESGLSREETSAKDRLEEIKAAMVAAKKKKDEAFNA